ncbi:MAG: AMP-binding protein [Actinomycetota bacterium]|nr:AMP-binding protein [Actinomycetota bacterium]
MPRTHGDQQNQGVWRIDSGEAERQQARVAGGLKAAGLEPGDRLCFVLGASPHLLHAVIGALRVGVVPVVLNPALLPGEREALVADAQPTLVVDDDATLAGLFDAMPVEPADVPLARPMHYTSGTSGRPKGVWSGVLDEADARAMFDDEAGLWGFGPDDVHLVCSPLHHSASLRFAASALLRGGSVLLLPRFDAAAVATALGDHGVTTAFMVPTHLQRLFALDPAPSAPTLRLLAHAGEACRPSLKLQALGAFPSGSVWEFYGSTEGQFTVCGPDEWEARPGTVGRARPGRRLEADEDGCIWCHVPPFARFEYWRDPQRTAQAWRGDAFTVGDVGRLDADGYLFLDGRRDDLVITGGVNVYPAEVEAALADVAGVQEVAVFGVPDERWGRRVCAAVIGEVAAADVLAEARARLAPYKCPKEVHIVHDLPRTSMGKVRRGAIAAALGLADDGPA